MEIKLRFLVKPKFLNHKNQAPDGYIVSIYPSFVATVRKKIRVIFATIIKSQNANIESRVVSSTIDK